MLIGYARVSTAEQDTALQVAAFGSAGVAVFFEESRSGAGLRDRLELIRLLDLLVEGDTLVVYKVDRLARSLSDLLELSRRLERSGVALRSLTEPIDTSTPAGRMIFQLLGVFAEFERSVILERCAAGRRAAQERGSVFGRRRVLDYGEVFRLRESGLTFRAIAERFACSHSAAVRAWHRVRRGETPRDRGAAPACGEKRRRYCVTLT